MQLLQLVDTFVEDDPRWVLFTGEIAINNLVVSNSGQITLLDWSQASLHDE